MATARRVFTAEDHQRHFAEFLRAIAGAGGATPHLTMIVRASFELDARAAAWLGFMYAATYNYAAAEALAATLVPEALPEDLPGWLRARWRYIPLRRERKAVRAPERLATCIRGFSVALELERWQALDSYEVAWDWALNTLPYVGRYIAIRLIEFLRRRYALPLGMPDIRAHGGLYPRQALALLYPGQSDVLLGDNWPTTVHAVEAIANGELVRLHALGLGWVDHYALQALLCEYKQSALGRRQYPGRSLDSELGYWAKAYDPAGPFARLREMSRLGTVRAACFPACHLGEQSGWAGVRDELGPLLNDYGYIWSDAHYDYRATRQAGAWADPVRRL
jgi:hypothetical protein